MKSWPASPWSVCAPRAWRCACTPGSAAPAPRKSASRVASPLPKDGRGWVTVDAHLRVPGFPGVWALGDCARVPDILHPGHHHPAMAQHAIREADQLAHNIVTSIRGARTRPFRYRTLGYMATIGRFTGIGLIGPFRVWGFLAWFLWRTYYLWRLPRPGKRPRRALGRAPL